MEGTRGLRGEEGTRGLRGEEGSRPGPAALARGLRGERRGVPTFIDQVPLAH